ncbi:MAG: hypothetical protein R3D99_10710 [Altererythrobacter sp.]
MKPAKSPFALSLSKGRFFFERRAEREVQGFDKLSPNGLGRTVQ